MFTSISCEVPRVSSPSDSSAIGAACRLSPKRRLASPKSVFPGCFLSGHPTCLVDNLKSLGAFRPQALVGSVRPSASTGSRRKLRRNGASRIWTAAVFVITDFRDAPLNDEERTALWRAFSVPVYELVLADDGALLASECEAQEGWHIEAGVRFSRVNDQLWYSRRGRQTGTGLVGEIQDEPCPCGRPGQRITKRRNRLPRSCSTETGVYRLTGPSNAKPSGRRATISATDLRCSGIVRLAFVVMQDVPIGEIRHQFTRTHSRFGRLFVPFGRVDDDDQDPAGTNAKLRGFDQIPLQVVADCNRVPGCGLDHVFAVLQVGNNGPERQCRIWSCAAARRSIARASTVDSRDFPALPR